MQHNFDEKSIEKAKALAQTPIGMQLSGALQQIDPTLMSKVEAQVAAGDYTQLRKTLAPLMASEEFKKLLRQLGG